MKKIITVLILAIASVATAVAALPFDKYTIKRDELPAEAREMLDEHFPKAKISMIKVDRHLLKKTDYDVRLTNGTKIKFSNKGKWTSIEMGKGEVPEKLLHSTIRRHLDKNYSGLKVRGISKKIAGYEITLSDNTLLRYDLLGTFKGVADNPTGN